MIVSITPLTGPSVASVASAKVRETDTPRATLYGTSRMSSVEPVLRKRTRKVGRGRFIKQYRGYEQVHVRG